MRIATCLLALLALAATAFADDDVLQLRSGRLVVGEITGTDDTGVTVRTEAGEARFDWSALTPLSEIEIRSDRLDPKDAQGRVDLAERCIRYGLYPYARRELATARGLGYTNTRQLDALEETAAQAEADATFAEVDQLTMQEEYEEALDAIRKFLIQAPKSAYTEKARAMANDLLRRIDNQKLVQAEEAEELAKTEKKEQLARRIAEWKEEVEKHRAAANAALARALKYHEIGNVTRTRKGYEGAEKNLILAYRTLRKIQRAVRRGVPYDKAEEEKETIRKKLVEVYLGFAHLFIDDKNYRSGVVYVNKALYLDPVNKEALDLRQEIDENRIHRSARKLTNTPGVRVTGN